MRAFVLDRDGWGLREVPDPRPAAGQVVVRTTAAGLCHSDLTLAARPPDAHPFALPLVLGHELAGTVVERGPGVTGDLALGTPVVGYGPRGCGHCAACATGAENYCRTPGPRFPPGLGTPGALAELVAVDARHLLPAPDLAPAQGAALSDAGLTALHALDRALAAVGLPPEELTVVVLGVGGLGHVAVQLARLAGAAVIAVDRVAAKLDLARRLGADHVLPAGPELPDAVRELTGGRGADVVIDLVGSSVSLAQAGAMVAVNGVVSVVGVGSGRLAVGMHALPLGVRTDLPFWGTRPELARLLGLAAAGQVRVEVEEIALDDVPAGYDRLAAGEVLGRAVAALHP
ncbi:alcohol dehydrogenase catalytic domain-containing protein [Pimelobacter simplex]|uniref:Alcohol dehydrogenase catalytic domain-containing protein n=1 Tax=Nocardioides simplex TaxID=2045 RepID=A0A7J5E1L1_NOCSI|nr:zinc-binding dehydrogenase [Pimelobacter simplex]KAB2812150.1 alcohol dehydrogenase catalytic domain-containing protein [Pimelobacter simplex]